MPAAKLTQPAEDYLKAIYELEQRHGSAGTSDVAAMLSVAPASVTGMVHKLVGQGLLTHLPYRGIHLTTTGRRLALRTIRRHRILESYLTQALGVPWDAVHEEAERLEHAVSDMLIDRMAAALGHPAVDPHGAPIPTADGDVDEPTYRSLAEIAVGESVRVMRVHGRDPVVLQALDQLALHPGAEVTLVARHEGDGALTLSIGSALAKTEPALACRVLVEAMPTRCAS